MPFKTVADAPYCRDIGWLSRIRLDLLTQATDMDGQRMAIAAPARSETEPGRVLALCSAVEVAVERAITRLFQPAANPVA